MALCTAAGLSIKNFNTLQALEMSNFEQNRAIQSTNNAKMFCAGKAPTGDAIPMF
jgi:hypothetical protein